MLYLEDYLEMIEHLPIELRDRFTEMREIDLGVENTVDSLQDRQKTFFAGAAAMSNTEREEQYNNIRKDYTKVVEESKEKIQIAEESYGLVDRYLRKLDQELHKFQLELEADNRGITEILEKRSLELDAPASRPSSFLKENRAPKKLKTQPHHTTIAHGGGMERVMGRMGAGATLAGAVGGGGGGAAIQPIQVNQTMPLPSNFNFHGTVGGTEATTSGNHGAGQRVPIYSHSTITRTNAGMPSSIISSAADGGNTGSPTNVYIQNNFYTLPPGMDLPPSHALSGTPTPEALVQAQQSELMQNGSAMAAALGQQAGTGGGGAPYTTTFTLGGAQLGTLQPLYAGGPSNVGDYTDNTGGQQELQHHNQQQQQLQQMKTMGHPSYPPSSHQH